jgi:hypothetical protein
MKAQTKKVHGSPPPNSINPPNLYPIFTPSTPSDLVLCQFSKSLFISIYEIHILLFYSNTDIRSKQKTKNKNQKNLMKQHHTSDSNTFPIPFFCLHQKFSNSKALLSYVTPICLLQFYFFSFILYKFIIPIHPQSITIKGSSSWSTLPCSIPFLHLSPSKSLSSLLMLCSHPSDLSITPTILSSWLLRTESGEGAE